MAEEEVQYASVVFKNKKERLSKPPKEEEVVYDEVKVRSETPQQFSDSKGLLSENEAERKSHYHRTLACCLGTFCIILVLGITGLIVYFVFIHEDEQNKLKVSEAENKNLTALNSKFRLDNKNLTDRIDNLTQDYKVLEKMNKNLTVEKQELETQNQKLEGEKKTLKQEIENLQKTQTDRNVSQAQWSIDAYCPKEAGRKCEPCQNGWRHFQSSCYAFNNAKGSYQRSFDEAQQDCHGKVSLLIVVNSQQEKDHLSHDLSPAETGITGYWIGLKAVEGKWKWIDGTELTNQSWINRPANNNQCVTTLSGREWTSVSCDLKNAWICEKKALSV